MRSTFDASRRASTADEPALSRRIVQSVQFQRQQILEPSIDVLPAKEFCPAENFVRVRRIEPRGFKFPSFPLADFVRKDQYFPLRLLLECNGILLCVLVVEIS